MLLSSLRSSLSSSTLIFDHREYRGFKAEFTLNSSSVKVGFKDITISILEKSQSLLLRKFSFPAVREIEHANLPGDKLNSAPS